jgi:phage baseplate assembly protein gpV
VVCAAAGRRKGIVALPDVDDQVLVVLPHGDPATGFVLGALFGAGAPPDTGVAGRAVRRWSLRTPGGHSVVLDDAAGTVCLRNAAGSGVDLGPDRLRVYAATDMVLEAPGKALVIRAATVDFEQATGS